MAEEKIKVKRIEVIGEGEFVISVSELEAMGGTMQDFCNAYGFKDYGLGTSDIGTVTEDEMPLKEYKELPEWGNF